MSRYVLYTHAVTVRYECLFVFSWFVHTQNKSKALQVIRARLYEMQRREKEEAITKARASQVHFHFLLLGVIS